MKMVPNNLMNYSEKQSSHNFWICFPITYRSNVSLDKSQYCSLYLPGTLEEKIIEKEIPH